MRENNIVRELREVLGTKEDDIIKTLERFRRDIEQNKIIAKELE